MTYLVRQLKVQCFVDQYLEEKTLKSSFDSLLPGHLFPTAKLRDLDEIISFPFQGQSEEGEVEMGSTHLTLS